MRLVGLKIIIIAFLTMMMFVPVPDYLETKCFLSAVTHHLWHTNWAHLAVNAIAIWLVFAPGRNMSELALGWGLASLSYVAAVSPVIGFSNILFAMSGLHAASYPSSYWKQSSTWVFFAMMIGMAFFPMFSATTHIVAFILGLIFGKFRNLIKQTLKDYERVVRR